MAQRVAEHAIRTGWFGRRQIVRVDLHGVSAFSPGGESKLVRWEWIDEIAVEGPTVAVRSSTAEVTLPKGAFGLAAGALAQCLQEARSIERRPEVIAHLGASAR